MRGRLTLLYGSQTGCAEEVAQRICAEAVRMRYEPACVSMDEYDVRQLPSEGLVIMIASTTGEGEVPDGMKTFWQFLLRRDLPPHSLAELTHACFGLGDSSYPKFNFAAKRLHRRLEQLGSTALLPLGLGDDQDGLGVDHALEPWLASLWSALDLRMPLPSHLNVIPKSSLPSSRYEVVDAAHALGAGDSRTSGKTASVSAEPSKQRPHRARVLRNVCLTKGSEREVRHIELDVSGWGTTYASGDALAVMPLNPLKPTLDLLAALGIVPDATFIIRPVQGHALPLPRCEWTALELFQSYLDIFGVPRRPFFTLLVRCSFRPRLERAAYSLSHRMSTLSLPSRVRRLQSHFATLGMHAEKLAELGSTTGAADLLEYSTRCRRTYAEVLLDFPTARPPIEYYLDLIPPLRGVRQLGHIIALLFYAPMQRRHVHRCTLLEAYSLFGACVPSALLFDRVVTRSTSNFRPYHSGRGTIFHPTASTAFWHMLHVSRRIARYAR